MTLCSSYMIEYYYSSCMLQVMGALSEEQYKSGSCFQTVSITNSEDSPTALRPGLLASFI